MTVTTFEKHPADFGARAAEHRQVVIVGTGPAGYSSTVPSPPTSTGIW